VDFVRSDARKKYEPSKHYARKSDFCALVEATLMYIRKLGMFLMKITQNHTKKKNIKPMWIILEIKPIQKII